jgi:hypothetical protein
MITATLFLMLVETTYIYPITTPPMGPHLIVVVGFESP